MRNNKKDLFIETASKLFSLKGYHATGLNEILKASKAPKGSLYYYFPNGKEELALEAIRFTIHDILEQLQNRFEGFSNPCEAIVFHINFLADLIETNQRTKYLSLCLVALETYDSSEILRNACDDAFQMMEKFYMKRLLGFGFDQITAEELAVAVSTIIEGGIIMSLTHKSGEPLRKIARQVACLLNYHQVRLRETNS